MTLESVRLTLALDPESPDGSRHHGYELVAPLDDGRHLDLQEWHETRGRCTVRRFWADEDDELGHLIHARGRAWAFHYDIEGEVDEDEPGCRFHSHRFKSGEYVSVCEQDGTTRTFRVESVKPVAARQSWPGGQAT